MTELDKEKLKTQMDEQGLTLATAESLTAGLVQAEIGSISGASTFFMGGATAYNLDEKVRLFNVDRAHAHSVNSVSNRVAEELAIGACNLFCSSVGLGTTGYAEPYPEENIEVPMAYIAICMNGQIVFSEKVEGPDLDRNAMREHVTDVLLKKLIKILES